MMSLLIRCDVHSCWYSVRSLLEIHWVPGCLNAIFMMSLKKCSVPSYIRHHISGQTSISHLEAGLLSRARQLNNE